MIAKSITEKIVFEPQRLQRAPGCRMHRHFLYTPDGRRHSVLHFCGSRRSLLISLPMIMDRNDLGLCMLRFFHDEKIPIEQAIENIRLLGDTLSELPPSLTRKANSLLDMINNSCMRIMNSIISLSENASLLMDLSTVKKRRHDLVGLVRSACADIALTAMSRGILLCFDCEISQLYVHVDEGMIRRIIRNLLSNAFKHMSKGGAVNVRLERLDGMKVMLSVSDTGTGIPPGSIDRIFDRFVTVSGDSNAGMGLGLNNVKSMVALHGGTVRCNSVLGKGTSIQVVLPIPCQRVRVSSSFALNPRKLPPSQCSHADALYNR